MSKIRVRILAVLSTTIVVAGTMTSTAAAAAPPPSTFSGTTLQPTSTVTGSKSATGQLAKSDPAVLRRTDTKVVPIMVKLDYDAAAAYRGGIKGLPATSPQVTGRALSRSDSAVNNYLKHVGATSADVVQRIRRAVPAARVTGSYTVAYGGLSVLLPANQAKALLAIPGVSAVQADNLNHPTADVESAADAVAAVASAPAVGNDATQFIGANKVWPSLGGQKLAGKGVIVGVLDTGIWPEHPMLADGGYLPKPGPAGKTWGCQFGDGSVPALGAAFTCNNKLIGAYAFTDTNLAVNGTVPGEFCDTSLKTTAHPAGQCSARDADGHGTHTSTTAAGDPVDHSPLLGVDRGAISGVAPGASVIMYRVCLTNGCYSSDSVNAVNQAILDGANVLNFSIGGGANPYSDPVELAFLDAYAAGISVSASAGNDGPGAATAEHGGPWVTTVGASTFDRAFQSTLTLKSSDGATYTQVGTTLTQGVTNVPLVLAADVAGYTGTKNCLTKFPAGSLTGKVVVCERGGGGGGRVEKGYFASLGGAAGMILYNPTLQDTESDNHFLPAIHLADAAVLPFLTAHQGITATWATGTKAAVRGDVMAAFSSRGPVGTDFLKPDITAPGVQILAGNTPASIDIATGPTGQLYQAIAGTSMSSPHSAGTAALIKAVHPTWTPGQIKSAEMTSSVQSVVNTDGSTATPFDRGAGSIRANRAVSPTLTFDVPAAAYVSSSTDQLDRVDLNLPSIDANPLPGVLKTTRQAKNVSGRTQIIRAAVTTAAGLSVSVSPSLFTIAPGATRTLAITIDGTDMADNSDAFAQITFKPLDRNQDQVVLPVAARRAPGKIALSHSCSANPVLPKEVSTCTVSAQNQATVDTKATVAVTVPTGLMENFVSPPAQQTATGASWSGALTANEAPKVTSVATGPGPGPGYLPLSDFGVDPIAGVGDESISNFDVPAFLFGGETYTSVGVDSNGYVVIGGGSSADNECCEVQSFPDPARPNNVIAPFWTDLDPSSGGQVYAGTLTDGTHTYLVLDYEGVVDFGTTVSNTFEVWIQLGSAEGQWISYGALNGPNGQDLAAGVENRDGSSGVNITPTANTDYVVKLAPFTPGGIVTFRYQVSGTKIGSYDLIASVTADVVKGTTTKKVTLTIN